ncbi:hypothetical protein UA08_02225 [Talaromyces atroroseus]|uniref:Uncharacterized protein n=1 Tax=Talaromyces atroroseus TaxID=1441469 RepID=A0A225ALA2_TALAT|nr:hypothetical protein UA08_02225 [Talaromyces atroroseus]OKL62351.1 hypothetical protein UA08_02225 [Talaromyces atroroseus]
MSQSQGMSLSTPFDTGSLYRPQTNDTAMDSSANSIYSEKAALLYPSEDGSHPGFAPEQTLSRGLQVPSKTYRLTSGFEYPTVLSKYNVSQEDWTQFTREITESAKMSSQQWRTVIGLGIGTMAIGGIMVGFFGAIPAMMVAKRKRANNESRNLAAAMGVSPSLSSSAKGTEERDGEDERESSLAFQINQWNETFFKPRGLLIRIDMPYDDAALEDKLDVSVNSSPNSSRKGSVSSIEKEDREKARWKARERCRIVIIPTNRDTDTLSQATTLASESPYIPAVYE